MNEYERYDEIYTDVKDKSVRELRKEIDIYTAILAGLNIKTNIGSLVVVVSALLVSILSLVIIIGGDIFPDGVKIVVLVVLAFAVICITVYICYVFLNNSSKIKLNTMELEARKRRLEEKQEKKKNKSSSRKKRINNYRKQSHKKNRRWCKVYCKVFHYSK